MAQTVAVVDHRSFEMTSGTIGNYFEFSPFIHKKSNRLELIYFFFMKCENSCHFGVKLFKLYEHAFVNALFLLLLHRLINTSRCILFIFEWIPIVHWWEIHNAVRFH